MSCILQSSAWIRHHPLQFPEHLFLFLTRWKLLLRMIGSFEVGCCSESCPRELSSRTSLVPRKPAMVTTFKPTASAWHTHREHPSRAHPAAGDGR
jgi:hypothetical protein